MGSNAMSKGVSKQCTAQITDMLMAKESNQPWVWHLTVLVEILIYGDLHNRYLFYSVNREYQNR